MISLEQALDILCAKVQPLKKQEKHQIAVQNSYGEILAEDQFSALDLPPFAKSAMDGYAIFAQDKRNRYQVIETVPAGKAPQNRLHFGAAIKVMTGSPVPTGAIKVIPIEDVLEEKGGYIAVHRWGDRMHVCHKAEDVRSGDLILKKGTKLGALEIANLIACGITEIPVFDKIRIAILVTGDEIVDDPSALIFGKIMNSNGPLLQALCHKHQVEVVSYRIVPDDLFALIESINTAAKTVSLILLTGGVSMGDFDLVKRALYEAQFDIHFASVAIKPGKPNTFATHNRNGCIALGMPGNPVAVFLSFYLFALNIIYCLYGQKPLYNFILLPLAKAFKHRRIDRMSFVPCRLNTRGLLETVEYHGTAHLSALINFDGFFIVDPSIDIIAEGAKVQFLKIPG